MGLKVYRLYFLFFMLSVLLIAGALIQFGKIDIFSHNSVQVKKIQKVCKKKYLRKRKNIIPVISLTQAQEEIEQLLMRTPIDFSLNSTSLEQNSSDETLVNSQKVILTKVLKIINHLEEDAILSIATHTDAQGSHEHNLKLSQNRANILKNYFREKCTLPLIVAIGYGEEIPLSKENNRSSRRVEITLKRIK